MSQINQFSNLLGQANSFLTVLDQVSRAAALNRPVLVIGERGTGKELIAARLHYLSKRWDQTYVTFNCAAVNENLLESELFGHESGAFTGASKRHMGRFERADKGSLFLDELANTSALVQEKLLRVIEYGQFERVGGDTQVQVDTRLIAATNEDLPTLVEEGKFRADLLDRLAFEVITLPPLRERKEDILLLAEHFAINMAREIGFSLFSGFSESAQQTLLDYQWPGNIRELKNAVERSLYKLDSAEQAIEHIVLDPFASPYRPTSSSQTTQPSAQQEINPINSASTPNKLRTEFQFPLDFKQASQSHEITLIQSALSQAKYNQRKTAELLNVTYHQLRGYLKKYKLQVDKEETDDDAD